LLFSTCQYADSLAGATNLSFFCIYVYDGIIHCVQKITHLHFLLLSRRTVYRFAQKLRSIYLANGRFRNLIIYSLRSMT